MQKACRRNLRIKEKNLQHMLSSKKLFQKFCSRSNVILIQTRTTSYLSTIKTLIINQIIGVQLGAL